MPGANYPDGANLHIPDAVSRALRARGLAVPVVAVGKIGTQALAEKVIADGTGDLVGMARALLADPDIPRKWREGREDTVVRCVYGNVCKALDENFRRVDCTLWPRKLGQAPRSADVTAPAWPESGAGLRAEYNNGRVLLRWEAAVDPEGLYGYELLRAERGGFEHYASVRAASLRFEDARVTGGNTVRYALRPYDLAGNRGLLSAEVAVDVPAEHRSPTRLALLETDRDPGASAACVANARS
ncbi:MAG: hypothetical protein U0169_12040 [Polyangiaceae bacterium]